MKYNGISNIVDVHDLQVYLEAIYHWADDNIMKFNNTKFECLRYGYKNYVPHAQATRRNQENALLK